MKSVMDFLKSYWLKDKALSSLFSEALSEGIMQTFKQMGYKTMNDGENKEEPKNEPNIFQCPEKCLPMLQEKQVILKGQL